MGPVLVERACAAAPVPLPPQPTNATWISSLPWACAGGRLTPANADAAAAPPVALMNCRRVERDFLSEFMIARLSGSKAAHIVVIGGVMSWCEENSSVAEFKHPSRT